MSSCYCDGDQATEYSASRSIARTAHRCAECFRQIRPGELYEHACGIWDGSLFIYLTCTYCLAMRDMIESRGDCFCWQHCNLMEDIGNWLIDDDTPGLKMAIGRVAIERKRDRI